MRCMHVSTAKLEICGDVASFAQAHGRKGSCRQRAVPHRVCLVGRQGSCTACVLVLEGNTLHAANLGDSGFLVLRGKRVLFRSRTQQHQFNFPYQARAWAILTACQ